MNGVLYPQAQPEQPQGVLDPRVKALMELIMRQRMLQKINGQMPAPSPTPGGIVPPYTFGVRG